MAATGFTPVSLYYSATASNVPLAANLVAGELAMNTNDGRLFYKDSSGVVQTMASKGTGSIGGSTTQIQFNNAGALGGSASLTWSGTVLTSSGFAGPLNGTVGATTPAAGSFTTTTIGTSETLSYGTANGVAYLDGSKVLTSGSLLTFTGGNLTAQGSVQSNTFFSAVGGGVTSYYFSTSSGTTFNNSTAPYLWQFSGSEKMRLDSSGNLGLGVTPSAWSSAYKAFQFGQRGAVYAHTSISATNFSDNVFDDGSAKYIVNGTAQRYQMGAGQHIWYTAPSGTAGNAISFTQAMTLDTSGLLQIGTTSNTGGGRVDALSNATSAYTARSASSGAGTTVKAVRSVDSGASNFSNAQYDALSHAWILSNSTQAMTLDSSGNVGIGTSSPTSRLSVNGAADVVALQVTNAAFDGNTADVMQIQPSNGAYYGKLLKITSGRSDFSDSLLFLNTTTGMNGTNGSYLRVQNSSSADIFRIGGNGNVGIGITSPSTPLHIQADSSGNSTRVQGRSSDGYADISLFNNANTVNNAFFGSSNAATFLGTGTTIPLTFQTNNTERMRIDSSGNLLVGTTSSTYGGLITSNGNIIATGNRIIGINGTGVAAGTFAFRNSVGVQKSAIGSYYNIADEGNIEFLNGTTTNAVLTSSGNLLVGLTSAIRTVTPIQAKNTTGDTVVYLQNTNASPYGLRVNYTNSPNGSDNWFFYADDGTTLRFSVRSNGGIANYAANNVILSDRREKINFAPATSYLDKICAIPVQTFNYIDQNLETDGGLTLGVVAQDVQAVAPELVTESNWASKDEEPKMRLSIYQTDLQYALMKALQELKAEFDAYKASHP